MKAIILAAGVGSRLRPLTENTPKSLLEVGGQTILSRMITHLTASGINEIVIVTGYLADKIKSFVTEKFPELQVTFVHNENYETTNTGYSLLLTRQAISESDFVKFDADVAFDKVILDKLLADSRGTCLCIDRNINLAAEEVKVRLDDEGKAIRVSKSVDPAEAVGESIGIEKITTDVAAQLYPELEAMMADPANHQEYYEGAYERLIAKGAHFYTVDITGDKWVEIDSHEDYALANRLF